MKEMCDTCGGQGWYMDGQTDDPQQRQCQDCNGTGTKMNDTNINETAGNQASYQSACAAVAKVVAQNMISGVADSQVLNYDDVISIIYGIDQKKVMQQMDVLIKQKLEKLKHRQGVKETILNIIKEVITEGEEERFASQDAAAERHWNDFDGNNKRWQDDEKFRKKHGKLPVEYPDDPLQRPTNLGHLRNKPQIGGMVGITFFNVKPGQEADAVRNGLSKFKSGKWGLVHRKGKDEHSHIMPGITSKFGHGNYWEPKK